MILNSKMKQYKNKINFIIYFKIMTDLGCLMIINKDIQK